MSDDLGVPPAKRSAALNAAWASPSIFDEHQIALRWAATVMAREIELHYHARGDLLDQHTVEALARHLREISLGERDPWGLVLDRGHDDAIRMTQMEDRMTLPPTPNAGDKSLENPAADPDVAGMLLGLSEAVARIDDSIAIIGKAMGKLTDLVMKVTANQEETSDRIAAALEDSIDALRDAHRNAMDFLQAQNPGHSVDASDPDRPTTHINYGAPTETTQLPPSAEPYVERSDTDLPAHPTA